MELAEIRGQLESLLSESRYMASCGDPDGIFREGEKALEETLDMLHDYELQAGQIKKDAGHFHTDARPRFINGVWLCPACSRRVGRNNTYCHWCGKKLGWGISPQRGGKVDTRQEKGGILPFEAEKEVTVQVYIGESRLAWLERVLGENFIRYEVM